MCQLCTKLLCLYYQHSNGPTQVGLSFLSPPYDVQWVGLVLTQSLHPVVGAQHSELGKDHPSRTCLHCQDEQAPLLAGEAKLAGVLAVLR